MKSIVSLSLALSVTAAILSGCASMGEQAEDRPLPLYPGTYISSDDSQVWVFWENGMFEHSAGSGDGSAVPQLDWGQWHDLNGMGVAIARGGRGGRYFLDVVSSETVALKRSEVTEPATLLREDDAEPLETDRPMAICFMTRADAPLAYEPLTRRNWPVQMEAAYPELEAAYLESGLEPPARLPMQVTAHWVMDDAPDRGGEALFLRASALDALGEPGAGACPQVALQDTYWVLKKLGKELIEPEKGKRAVHIIFGEDRKVSGLAGCNRFSSAYTRRKDDLALGPVAATRMMCPDRADIENALFLVLDRTERFAIEGQTLLLMTEDGKVLAEFEAGTLE